MRLRLQYEKRGAVRFMSHRDVVRAFQRCFAAGAVPIVYSQGFHPHMKMSFGPPPKTGWESRGEYMDIEVEASVTDLTGTCNPLLPEGLRIVDCKVLDQEAPKVSRDICAVRLCVSVAPDDASEAGDTGKMRERIMARFTERAADAPSILEVTVVRDDGGITIDYMSTLRGGKTVTPTEVVETAIGEPDTFAVPMAVVRSGQYATRDGEYVSPMRTAQCGNGS